MKAVMYAQATLVAALPAALLLLLVSQLSPLAPPCVEFLALLPRGVSYSCLAVTILCGVVFFFLSQEYKMPAPAFWMFWWTLIGMASSTAAFALPHHPCFAIAALTALGPALLYALRQLLLSGVDTTTWFSAAFVATATAGACCLLIWLTWIVLGFPGRSKWTDWPPPVRSLVERHVISWKCAFVLWATPLAVGLELCFVALLCWVRRQYTSFHAGESSNQREVFVVSTIKQMAGWLIALIMLIWIHAAMCATGEKEYNQTREDMSDEVVGLAFCIGIGMLLWMMDTLGPSEVAVAVEKTRMVQETRKLLQNDWVRASFLLMAMVPMALFLGMHKLYAKVRGRSAREHEEGSSLLAWASNWRWTSVLAKASWLGLLYVMLMVLCGKLITVILAMVNEGLVGWPVFSVSAVLFFIAFTVFMFPASPGPPIYVVMGIIICSSCNRQGWSFNAGLAWATLVAYLMKLSFTAAAQKWIGEPFSKNDRVRRLVGVHTPYMRAIEVILKDPRVTLAKVTLVVGGPDWPVAVLCGILRLRVWPIMVCISPVLIQSVFPCVLAGALLLAESGEQRQSRGLAEVMLVVAGALQLATGVVAFYFVQEVLENKYEELSQSRPQDGKLEELELKAEARDNAFWRETAWEMLPLSVRLALVAGLLCAEGSVCLLVGYGHCFKSFDLMSSVEHDLGGSILGVVQPMGWLAMALALADGLFLGAFYAWTYASLSDGGQRFTKERAEKEGRAFAAP